MDKQFRLFLGCFIALVATAFGFAVRGAILADLAQEFELSNEQLGYIIGAGLYPFAISIILLSFVIDKIGYGLGMTLAFLGHLVSAVMTIFAGSFEMLYCATFLYALANGTVEAVINPVVTSMYAKEKTHWLNILHAGWPGGLVLGGLLAIAISFVGGQGEGSTGIWRWQMAIVLLPTLLYGILLFKQKFPVQERVAAGVSYMDMLREFGWGSAYICFFLLMAGFNQIIVVAGVEAISLWWISGIAIIPTVFFGIWVKSFGRPMFVFMLLVMFLLATTELGTDGWIADIMRSVLGSPTQGILFLVYTSLIMFILRFFAGPIVHRISPLGLLACCAAIAAVGLYFLSAAGAALGWLILAATLYGVGKTFFWPTTLGVVSEQYPKGGALMLNAIAGVGMIAVGTIGSPAIGYLQDRQFDQVLLEEDPELHEQVVTSASGLFGDVNRPNRVEIDSIRQRHAEVFEVGKGNIAFVENMTFEQIESSLLETLVLTDEQKQTYQETRDQLEIIDRVDRETKQGALARIAVLPAIMFLCYVGLIIYFRSKGGYKVEVLTGHAAVDEESTGGVEDPVE